MIADGFKPILQIGLVEYTNIYFTIVEIWPGATLLRLPSNAPSCYNLGNKLANLFHSGQLEPVLVGLAQNDEF
jgi:hypothetical protein